MHARPIGRSVGTRWMKVSIMLVLLWGAGAPSAGVRASPPYTLISTGTLQDAFPSGVSVDGTRVFFMTTEALSPNDTDTARDLYLASGGAITLLSDGTAGADANTHVTYRRQTPDGLGNRVFFSTTERLVALDQDAALDVYEASNGTVTLLTGGTQNIPADLIDGGNGDLGVSFDGSRVLFMTTEALDPVNDTDTRQDLYEASGGTVTLISHGDSNDNVFFDGMTSDGSKVYFSTSAILDPNDTNNGFNIYEASGGQFRLVTPGDAPSSPTWFGGASADGSRVILTTTGRWRPGPGEDEDTTEDCYLWSRSTGTWELLSGRSLYPAPDPYGNICGGITPDGTKIFIDAAQDLSPADGNQDPTLHTRDVYQWSAGVLQLLTSGSAGVSSGLVVGAFSPDGSKLVISSNGQLTAQDTDNQLDRYLLTGGTYELLSPGNPASILWGPLSPDLTRQYFTTADALDASDTDGVYDVYMGSGGVATLLTPGTTAPAIMYAASTDGTRVIFYSQERLAAADTDASYDFYEASPPSVDTEAPLITVAIDGSDQVAATGWYNIASSGSDGVRVHVSATDATAVTNLTATDSGVYVLNISADSGSFVLGDGRSSITVSASDGVNVGAAPGSTAMPLRLSIDQTAPVVTCLSPPTVTLNAAAAPVQIATVSDATSGPVASSIFMSLDTSTLGLRTVQVSGADLAGNAASQTCAYRVEYQFTGFGAPVSSPPNIYVSASVGKNIPLTFSVADGLGPVAGLPARSVTESAAVDPSACTGTPTRTLAAADYPRGKSGLLNLGGGNYEYRWKASRSAAGQCQVVSLDLGDGVLRSVAFLLTP
jgi:hypothetical protein